MAYSIDKGGATVIQRHLGRRLLKAVKDFAVVSITGPRQSGKTTLARMVLPRHEYVSLEDPDERRLGLGDRYRRTYEREN